MKEQVEARDAGRQWHLEHTSVPPYANSPFVAAFEAGAEWERSRSILAARSSQDEETLLLHRCAECGLTVVELSTGNWSHSSSDWAVYNAALAHKAVPEDDVRLRSAASTPTPTDAGAQERCAFVGDILGFGVRVCGFTRGGNVHEADGCAGCGVMHRREFHHAFTPQQADAGADDAQLLEMRRRLTTGHAEGREWVPGVDWRELARFEALVRAREQASHAALTLAVNQAWECARDRLADCPDTPMRVDEMNEREYGVFLAAAHALGALTFIEEHLRAALSESTQEAKQ